ncbi:hypothetical protein [Roseomonas sp. USHLN139]|uniref:hypothetical protein n=1 Tax=Roseomonas sp. USHLN139 TaxID=3081298 RepID=UPI003B019131
MEQRQAIEWRTCEACGFTSTSRGSPTVMWCDGCRDTVPKRPAGNCLRCPDEHKLTPACPHCGGRFGLG